MSNITKHHLVTDISVTTGISQIDIKKTVECFLDFITNHLEKGNTVEIRGFGRFSVKSRKQRPVRNPRTGAEIILEERRVPVLKFCDDVRKRIDRQCAGAQSASYTS
jgi:nucleoid DNA-binding protein